jgi:hypothetical protein
MDRNGYRLWQGLLGLYLLRDNEEIDSPLPVGEFELPLILCDSIVRTRLLNADIEC